MSTHAAARSRTTRRGAVAASILALAWALAGCTSGADESTSGGEEYGYAGTDSDAAVAEEDMGTDGAGEIRSDDRALIVTSWMYMTVEDPLAAADAAVAIVADAGGRIDSRSETADGPYGNGAAQLTLRVPAGSFDPVVVQLRTLGTVDEFSTDTADVTTQVTDLEAQISTLRASTTRIEGLLADAEDIKDIITLEDELDSRQAELESLEARQRGLDDQVSMSTIDLSLTTEPVVEVDDSPRSFWSGLESGWSGLVSFLGGVLVVTGVLLPWLVAAAVLGAVALAVVRARRARGARATAASSAAPEEPATTSSTGD
ncbi:DUF4349 domain-containing protein [Demequina gelatinilytica]|uniref:DUF4349 domain-containing protein n=1 Tax=Demequina gelatinilytica TaxID=1638980 RepID=UPI0007808A9E|nr:DUF4349 domain-containing protein [Demequina gelatinilytica]